MMTGRVSGRRATLPVTLRLPNQPDLQLEFILDTGFNGFLTLPAVAVAKLALPFRFRIPANLADGSSVGVAVHSATILWHGAAQQVDVLATGRQPLLGTALLDSNKVEIEFTDGGLLKIEPLPASASP